MQLLVKTPAPPRKGLRALVGVLIAMIGALAAAYPDSPALQALNQAVPRLADILPTLITIYGAILAGFSQPPGTVGGVD